MNSNVSTSYTEMMASDFREVGEMLVTWYTDDASFTTFTSDELSMNTPLNYETFFDPLMTELPYTKLQFTVIDTDGVYDPMATTDNGLEPMQKVVIVYRQYLDSDLTTYEDVTIDTLYTTGESAYQNKEFTIYCQDRLSIALTSEDKYSENDTYYTVANNTSLTTLEVVTAILGDIGIEYSTTITDTTEVGDYITEDVGKVELLQALLNGKMWSIFMLQDVAQIVDISTTITSSDVTDYELTSEDIYSFPSVKSTTQAKQMNVYYYNQNLGSTLTLVSSDDATVTADTSSDFTMELITGTFNYSDPFSQYMTARYNSQPLRSCFVTWQKNSIFNGSYSVSMNYTRQQEYTTVTDETSFSVNNLAIPFRSLDIVKTVSSYPSTPTRNGEIKELDNRMVNDSLASTVAEYYYNYSIPKNHFSVSFKGEPVLQLNDLITVETEWENDVVCRISQIVLNFNGALSGNLTLSKVEVSE